VLCQVAAVDRGRRRGKLQIRNKIREIRRTASRDIEKRLYFIDKQ